MVTYYFKPKNYIHRNNFYHVIYAHFLRRQFNKSPKQIDLYDMITRNFRCGCNNAPNNITKFILVHKVDFKVCLQQFNNIARFFCI